MNGHSDEYFNQIDKEEAEAAFISAIHNWRNTGLGDEHLLNTLLATHPSLVQNMAARIMEFQKKSQERLELLIKDTRKSLDRSF
jgi:hypothetical protein